MLKNKPNYSDYEVASLLTGDMDRDVIEIAEYRENIEEELLEKIKKQNLSLAHLIVKGRYGLQGIYEDFEDHNDPRCIKMEKDYYWSIINSHVKWAWNFINEQNYVDSIKEQQK